MKSSNEEQLKALKDFRNYIGKVRGVYYRYYVGMKVIQNASCYISEAAKQVIDASDILVNTHLQEAYTTTDRIIMDGVPMRHKKDITIMIEKFKQQLAEYMSILYKYSDNNLKIGTEATQENFDEYMDKILQLIE